MWQHRFQFPTEKKSFESELKISVKGIQSPQVKKKFEWKTSKWFIKANLQPAYTLPATMKGKPVIPSAEQIKKKLKKEKKYVMSCSRG